MDKFQFMSLTNNSKDLFISGIFDWDVFRMDPNIKVEIIEHIPDLNQYYTSWYVDKKHVEVPFGLPEWYTAEPLALKNIQYRSVPDGHWEKIENIDLSQADEIKIITAELPQSKLLLLDGNKRMCAYFLGGCKCSVTEYRITPYCEYLSLDTRHVPWPELAIGK